MVNRRFTTLWLTPVDLCVFVIYCAMLAIFVPFHEPWADEAQAWLLSRDLSLSSLVFHALRHEAHPALWYVLLWITTHLHAGYASLGWLSAAIAAAGIWVLLRFAPFPFYIRALLPFTFFLGYQYSIVARSYVLFPLLGFLAAHLYRDRKLRPIAMAIILGLLANVSLHGTIIALAIAALYAGRIRALRTQSATAVPARQIWTGGAIFAGSVLLVAVCLWPTVGALPRFGPTLNRIIDRMSISEPSATQQQISPPLTGNLADPVSVPPAALPPKQEQDAEASGTSIPGAGRLAKLTHVLTYAFASSWLVAALFQVLVLAYLFQRGQIELALPVVLLAIFLAFVHSSLWHLGLLWIAVLMALWMAWDESVAVTSPDLQNGVAVFLAVICALQLPWTFRAFAYDARYPTAPHKAMAAYLRTLPPGSRIAGFGMSTGVQPYFAHNIFFNQPQTFGYLGRDRPAPTIEQAVAANPDYIVADPNQEAEVKQAGFREVREFCGALYFPNEPFYPACLIAFEPQVPGR